MASPAHPTITAFIDGLEPETAAEVQQLREIILSIEPRLTEHIKWSAPSFVLDGEDRITMNLRNKEGRVKLVLHMGATRPENKKGAPVLPDDGGIVDWASDIRGLITVADVADLRAKEPVLRRVLAAWLAIDHRAVG